MATQQKVIPHLWFDKEAQEAAAFYASFFPDSEITNVTTLRDTPSGDCDVVSFRLAGQRFLAISAGPLFEFTPSTSFIVRCATREEVDALWERFSDGGEALMPLDSYPFSERYGWIQDRFGLSWQLILADPDEEWRPTIVPCLLFVGRSLGKAEEAVTFYTSVFDDADIGRLVRYGKDQEPNKEGTIMFSDFTIENVWFAAMDGAGEHDFAFNEAVSFMVNCDTQDEIDYYWKKLSAVPEAEQCGWLKDRFGLSWQIVPADLDEMMRSGRPEQIERVTQAFLKMKKFDLAELRRAYTQSDGSARKRVQTPSALED